MKNILLLIAGFIALGIGAVGAVLPILPTTPFVLLAAACFGGSSPRLYKLLLRSRYFGEFIENYRSKQGVSLCVKVRALVFLWAALAVSAFFSAKLLVCALLFIVGVCVTIHIVLIKTK